MVMQDTTMTFALSLEACCHLDGEAEAHTPSPAIMGTVKEREGAM